MARENVRAIVAGLFLTACASASSGSKAKPSPPNTVSPVSASKAPSEPSTPSRAPVGKSGKAADHTRSSANATITREEWMDGMAGALPAVFCEPSMYFRQCFSVTEDECIEAALRATKVCLAKNREKIPPTLRQPDDGKIWGTVIGGCAGTTYEISLGDLKKNSPQCQDVSNWVPNRE